MKLVLPMYNAHPYFSLKNLGKNVHIIHSKIQPFNSYLSDPLRIRNIKKFILSLLQVSVFRCGFSVFTCLSRFQSDGLLFNIILW